MKKFTVFVIEYFDSNNVKKFDFNLPNRCRPYCLIRAFNENDLFLCSD